MSKREKVGSQTDTCHTDGCCNKAARGRRGLCRSCYQSLYRLVKAGQTSWAKLVKAGLALDTQGGRVARNPAAIAAQALLSKKK